MTDKMLAYQETDKKLKEIETVLSTSDARKQSYVAYKYISGVGDQIAKLDKKAEGLNAKYQELASAQKEFSEEIKVIGSDISAIKSESEASFMIKKVDELTANLKKTETELLSLQTAINSVKEEYDQIKINTKKAQESYKIGNAAYNELKDKYKDEIAKINAELDELKKGIDENLLKSYLEKRKDKAFPILVPVNGNRCSACGMELSMKDASDLESGKVIECENCRRLLYK